MNYFHTFFQSETFTLFTNFVLSYNIQYIHTLTLDKLLDTWTSISLLHACHAKRTSWAIILFSPIYPCFRVWSTHKFGPIAQSRTRNTEYDSKCWIPVSVGLPILRRVGITKVSTESYFLFWLRFDLFRKAFKMMKAEPNLHVMCFG